MSSCQSADCPKMTTDDIDDISDEMLIAIPSGSRNTGLTEVHLVIHLIGELINSHHLEACAIDMLLVLKMPKSHHIPFQNIPTSPDTFLGLFVIFVSHQVWPSLFGSHGHQTTSG